MSIVRPVGATHRYGAADYYKSAGELNWMRWSKLTNCWVDVGTMPAGSLTPLPPVQIVELEKFDAPVSAGKRSTACADTFCIHERLIGSEFCLLHGAAPAPAPAPAPAKDPHGVYKVQLTRWQADDGSYHESYEDAVQHGFFKDIKALMHDFMDDGEIEVAQFIASLLGHYKLERK